ncbi:tail fiber protein [Desulfovibrio sp. SGI.102]|uniref:tail fiber protein n=1 Tax=Desulfovibrio sp. SGI.102 TaxID=3420559 RepID=UPI003D074537
MAFPNLLKRLFDTNGAGVTLRGDIMPFSAEAPKAGGTASAGTSNTVARADHVHPAQTIGTASGTVYGTTKLSDATNSTSGADSGVAATPKAVKAAYDKAVEAKNAADAAASSIDPWNIFPMRVPIAIDGVTFGGSDGRRAIMPGETEAREDWILCDGGSDGKGGTVPDLRGRMIRGASDSVPAGSTGGSETHSHSISGTVGATTLSTSQMPSHTHSVPNQTGLNTNGHHLDGWSWGNPLNTDSAGGSQPHTHTLDGASGEASSLPPYYTLAYIMRCA